MFGKIMASVRKKAGFTQQKLANNMRVSRSRVKNIENGNNISVNVLVRYLNSCGYGVKIDIFDKDSELLKAIDPLDKIPELVNLRKDSGFTQEALGREMGLSRSRVEQIENGSENMKMTTLKNYVNACGYDVMIDIQPLKNEFEIITNPE